MYWNVEYSKITCPNWSPNDEKHLGKIQHSTRDWLLLSFSRIGNYLLGVAWHKTVVLASTAYPGYSISTVVRRVRDPITNVSTRMDVPCPKMLEQYNKYMGGVDKSNQYISYHKVIHKTAKYWKRTFYH